MRKKLLILAFILLSFSFFAQTEFQEQKKMSSYTSYLISKKKSLTSEKKDLDKFGVLRKSAFSENNNVDFVEGYIMISEELDFDQLRKMGVKVNSVFDDIITAQIPISEIDNLAAIKEITRIELAYPAKKRMDQARSFTTVDKIHRENINNTKYTGKGVIIGVIDNEFDYRHINFREKNGKNIRIKRVWDQNAVGVSPENYSYGAEYKTQEAILAIPYDPDADPEEGTHGTHVLGIATGSDRTNANIYYGVAPEAELVLVCYKKNLANDFDGRENSDKINNVSITDAIKYIYDYAESVGKPCVINMSLGSHFGPHDGSSSFDRIADKMQGKGRLLVGAVGNERKQAFHISHQFTNANDTLKTLLEFSQTKENETIVDIWGEKNKKFNLQFTLYDEMNKKLKEIFSVVNLDSNELITYDLNEHGLEGRIDIYRSEKNKENNRYNLFVCISVPERPFKKFLGFKLFDTEGNVHAWLADEKTKFTDKGLSGWSAADEGSTMGEIGGTGKRIISVGAYVSKNKYKTLSGLWDDLGEMKNDVASFSSMGSTLDGRIKPDISAPGASIISSYSGNNAFFKKEEMLFVKKTSLEGKDYYYGSMEGSSMAAPHVTGILALWLEAKNDLSPEDLSQILEKTAIKDQYTGNSASVEWGFGKIDAYKGLVECLKLDGKQIVEEVQGKKVAVAFINRTSKLMRLSFPSADLSFLNVKVFSLSGVPLFEKKIRFDKTTKQTDVDLSKLPNGVFILKINGEGFKDIYDKIIL